MCAKGGAADEFSGSAKMPSTRGIGRGRSSATEAWRVSEPILLYRQNSSPGARSRPSRRLRRRRTLPVPHRTGFRVKARQFCHRRRKQGGHLGTTAPAGVQTAYTNTMGAPSVPPGRYFCMRLVDYFEGIDRERGVEWRCCRHTLSLRILCPHSNGISVLPAPIQARRQLVQVGVAAAAQAAKAMVDPDRKPLAGTATCPS